jgi:hypothetical protein
MWVGAEPMETPGLRRFPAFEQRLLCDAVRQERKLARAMGVELDLRLRGR